jgi:hypothetical protein
MLIRISLDIAHKKGIWRQGSARLTLTRIDIVSVSSSLPKSEKGAKGKAAAYDVFTMTIKAEGNVVALLKFSSKLGEAFPDSVINSVSIGVSEEEGKSTISMGLTIYCYESS